MTRSQRALAAACVLGGAALGCGGGGPLLHPAHVLRPGFVSVGAGMSGQMALMRRAGDDAPAGSPSPGGAAAADNGGRALEELTVAPGVAPWVAGRVGLPGSNEAGLTYTGRAVRLDGRHAFDLGAPTLSVGLGAAALLARRPGERADGSSVYGVGFDIPVLLGFHSRSDLYAVWFGPRAGYELLSGKLQAPDATPADADLLDISGRHLHVGFVLGLRAGFRHLHVAVEAGAAYHRAEGELGGEPLSIEQGTIAPGGGLVVSF